MSALRPVPPGAPANRLGGLAVLLVYFAFFAAVFPDVLFGETTFIRRDIPRFYYPVWHYSAMSLLRGEVPLWNPMLNMGAPHLANVQTCVFYPPAALLFTLLPFARAFNLYILLHLAAAGAFTFLWMRECGASRKAALLSGYAYAAGGYMLSTVNLTIAMCTAAYLPLALWLFRRALVTGAFAWRAALGAALVVQYLAGDPANSLATILVLGVFTVYKTLEDSVTARRWTGRYAATFAWAGLVAAGLGAFQWPLFLELIARSSRDRLPSALATMWSMQYNDLISVVVPFFSDLSLYVMDYWVRQSWLENYYAGVTVLVLGAAALYAARRRGDNRVGYHVLLALFGLALAIGRHSLLYTALREVLPPLGLVRYPIRFFFLFGFAAACLAGFGLDAALSPARPRARRPGRRAAALSAGILCLAALAVLFSVFYGPIETRVLAAVERHFTETVKPFYGTQDLRELAGVTLANIRRSAVFAAFALLGLVVARLGAADRRLVAAYLGALVFTDLATANLIEPRVPSAALAKASSHAERLRRDPELFRFLASPKTVGQQNRHTSRDLTVELADQGTRLASNLQMMHGLQDALGYDSIYVREAFEVQTALLRLKTPDSPLVDLINAKYIVSPEKALEGRYRLLETGEPVNLFLNEDVLPRAFLVESAETVPDGGTALKRMSARDFDPTRTLFLREEAPSDLARAPDGGEGSVEITRYEPHRVRMSVNVTRRPWLFFGDVFYPGWLATVDGEPVKIYRANHAFRALLLSPGEHRIEWRYDPPLFRLGAAVSALTAAAIAAAVLRPSSGPLSFPKAWNRISL